jgi:hypothetical protein
MVVGFYPRRAFMRIVWVLLDTILAYIELIGETMYGQSRFR